jgi:hypothetical protein
MKSERERGQRLLVIRKERRRTYTTLETLLAKAEADLDADEARAERVLLTEAVGTALEVPLIEADAEGRLLDVPLNELGALDVALTEEDEGRALEVALAERVADDEALEEVVLPVRMVE